MRAHVLVVPLLVVAAPACSSGEGSPPIAETASWASKECAVEPVEADRFACAEAQFWDAFQQPELPPRLANEKTLSAVIAATETSPDAPAKGKLHFRLGQLRLTMALENGQSDYMLHSQTMIVGEFDAATALDPYSGIIAPWKDTMEIATAAILSDWEKAIALANRGFDNVKLNPLGNTLSLSGTTIGFPMSSGVPQRTVALLDAWTCSGVPWCSANTAHAPWARPGLSYHFAEAYARVGDRAKTKQYLDQALSSPGADAWPYRHVAADAAADVDAFLDKFAKLGPDGSAFDISYANQKYGCVFCHQR
jgi:hypothetical protein